MTREREVERAVLWAATEDRPALWALVDEVQAVMPDRHLAMDEARQTTKRLVREGFLNVLKADHIEGETVPVSDNSQALRLLADERWWLTPDTYEAPVVRVDITEAGTTHYKNIPRDV
jgi:hypothetical protein